MISDSLVLILGFAGGIVCMSIIVVLVISMRRKPHVAAGTENQMRLFGKHNLYHSLFPAMIVLMIGLLGSVLIYRQYLIYQNQVQYQKTQVAQQAQLIESTRMSGQVYLMGNILNKIDTELGSSPDHILSNETIARIVALSYSLRPYAYSTGSDSRRKRLSPERGQLLLALSNMGIDSSSLHRIKLQVTFAGADLHDANLREVDLSDADLRGADLRGADLRGADLRGADFRSSDLWGANLDKADLRRGDFKRADMRWAELNEADLRGADLSGAYLSSAKLRKADLREARMEWANLSGAFLNTANLDSASLLGSNLERAHFNDAHLHETNIRRTSVREMDLTGAILTRAIVFRGDWLESLNTLGVSGAQEIQENYHMVLDTLLEKSYRLINRNE